MAACTLPRSARLSGGAEFAAVFREGRRYGGRWLSLRARRNGRPDTRLGLAVRRGADGAVGRNAVKRRLREAFRLARPELPSGLDCVLMPTRATATAPLPELRAELLRLCARAAADPALPAPAVPEAPAC